MIGGSGAQFHGQRYTAEVVEFVSVDLERESQRGSFVQDLTRLPEREGARFAEDIHKGWSPPRGVSLPPSFE